jgi:hypothetical protein
MAYCGRTHYGRSNTGDTLFKKGNQLALLVGAGFLEYPFKMRTGGAELNRCIPRGILQRHAGGKRRGDVRFP